MRITDTNLLGLKLVQYDKAIDERGYFMRSWTKSLADDLDIDMKLDHIAISFNLHKYTLRGMHYQAAPFCEAKLVRCISGRIWDVVIDLRPDSSSFKSWYGVELSADSDLSLYIPPGFAHGFLSLEENSKVLYHISEKYVPDFSKGVRWDDPAFNIKWPASPNIISLRDASYPNY